ncbi:MAG TPA: matrixin family metalloprotease [Acidothermaceae bacterium]
MSRDVKLYLLALAALCLAFVLVVLLWVNDTVELDRGDVVDLPTSEPSGDEPTDAGKRVGALVPTEDSPKFDCERHGNQRCGQLPPVRSTAGTGPLPELCLVNTTTGFPVAEAAAEYDGLANVTVGGCDDAENVAIVQIVERPGAGWSGWYNSPNAERDGAALISLNVAAAYRMTPHGWHMALVHEIGHALGLDHETEQPSVMDPVRYASHTGLTAADVAALTR